MVRRIRSNKSTNKLSAKTRSKTRARASTPPEAPPSNDTPSSPPPPPSSDDPPDTLSREERRALFEEYQKLEDEYAALTARAQVVKGLRATKVKEIADKCGLKKTFNWNGALLQARKQRDGSFLFRSIKLGEDV